MIQAALAKGRPEAGVEALLRAIGGWDAIDPASRERVLGNAEVVITFERPMRQMYRPSEALLRTNRVPVQVGVGEESPPVMRQSAEWLASQLSRTVETTPGGHLGYMDHSDGVAKVLRSFLQRGADEPTTVR